MSLHIPFGRWEGGQQSFLISCFNLDSEMLFFVGKLRPLRGVSKRLGCWRILQLRI